MKRGLRAIVSTITAVAVMGFSAQAALADYGYENTIDNCSAHEAWTETTGTTIEIYGEPVEATANSVTMQFVPSFDDANCTVKEPMGYNNSFEGVAVAATNNVQTAVGNEEVQVVLNDDGSGEIEYTFSHASWGPGDEIQFRVDGIFTGYESVTDNEY